MAQKCYAAGSDTELHCIWCITREVTEDCHVMDEMYCEKHEKPCMELSYGIGCRTFKGYHPDWRMTDEEEDELINKLREED